MALKEDLIKKIAADKEVSEDIVFSVIAFQGQDALENIRLVHEIEFSGFGKFLLSQTKLKNKIKAFKKVLPQYEEDQRKTEGLLSGIEKLETKLR